MPPSQWITRILLVWLGFICIKVKPSLGLLKGDTQGQSYSYSNPETSEPPTNLSPSYGSILRSLFKEYNTVTEQTKSSYPPQENIRKSFNLITTPPPTTAHFEALTSNRNGSDGIKTYYINNQKVQVQNSQELLEKFKALRRGHQDNNEDISTKDPLYYSKHYVPRSEESTTSSGPSVQHVQQIPLRHWSTESNIIREDDANGSLGSFVTTSQKPYHSRGSVRYSPNPTTENPSFSTDYNPGRSGKKLPTQLFYPNVGNKDAVISPTTYRPQVVGNTAAYSFSFRTQNHTRQELGDSRGNFRGSIKFVDTYGRDKQIDYEGNPESGLVTSETPLVTIRGRTGQRYIPPLASSPQPVPTSAPPYSYSYMTTEPNVYQSAGPTVRLISPYPTGQVPEDDGSYLFKYNAGDHQRQEIRDNNGNVQGLYSFDGTDGERKVVQYEANPARGFVAHGKHLPVPHGIVIPGQLHYGEPTNDGTYFFNYDAGSHGRQEVRDAAGNVHGYYSFMAGDGEMKTVHYRASPEEGFVASGAHLPQHGAYTISHRVGQK